MSKIETIYSFQVLDKIKKGEQVYMVDRFERSLCTANRMRTQDLLECLVLAEIEESRFDFWVENNTESEGENE